MKSKIKRWLFLGISFSLAALTVQQARLRKELEGSVDGPDPKLPPPGPKGISLTGDGAGDGADSPAGGPHEKTIAATTVTLKGTVVRNGARFAVRETAGLLYPLDSTGRAWEFEGESVRVTGKLDALTRLLHIEEIEMEEVTLRSTEDSESWSLPEAGSGTGRREARSSLSPDRPSAQSETPPAAA